MADRESWLYFFVADILFLGVILDFNKYIVPWQTCDFWWVVLD